MSEKKNENNKKNETNEIKVILLGDTGVGKTSIILRYSTNKFEENCLSTIGSNFTKKTLKSEEDKNEYILNIWDTSGQEKYRAVTKLFVQDSNIVILVYSVDNKESFNVLDFWYKQVVEICGGEDNIIFAIVANKADYYEEKDEDELIPEEEGQKYANGKNAYFKSVSAKNGGKGIPKLFEELLNIYIERKPQMALEQRSFKINPPNKNKKDKKKGCC